jgi:phage/plasmid primase-like uncharacterized protein
MGRPSQDLAALAARFRSAVNPDRLQGLAWSLGLSVEALTDLGIGWSADHRAWSVPMKDARGNLLGIRFRRPNGFKFAVRGGREGLFVPGGATEDKPLLLIAEGPTDVAALLGMGFRNVVGRPSCMGGIRLLVELVQLRRPREVVIVADDDEAGRRGANNLASALVAFTPSVRVIEPPSGIKDARAWLQAGGRYRDVQQAIEAAPVRQLAIRTVAVKKG